jgi:hypothetical protein
VFRVAHPDCIITAHQAALEAFLQHQASKQATGHEANASNPMEL